MSDANPERWQEPIEEGLWRADTLFGIPFWLNLCHPVCWLLGMVLGSWWPVWIAAIVHAPLAVLTEAEPEWLAIFEDWIREPEEIDP